MENLLKQLKALQSATIITDEDNVVYCEIKITTNQLNDLIEFIEASLTLSKTIKNQ